MVLCDGLLFHPGCIPALHFVFLHIPHDPEQDNEVSEGPEKFSLCSLELTQIQWITLRSISHLSQYLSHSVVHYSSNSLFVFHAGVSH